MLVYEERRTEELVNRLVAIAKGVKLLLIFICIMLFAGIFTTISFLLTKEIPGIVYGGILGSILGFFIGNLVGNLLVVMLEWHAQALVAVENLIKLQKNR